MRMPKRLLVLAGALILGAAEPSLAKRCGQNPGDEAALANARAQIETTCPCAAAERHGAYVRCAKEVLKQLAAAGELPSNCRGALIRCAAQSTCGKPGFVTCCRTSARGVTKCKIRSSAARCTAPPGGSACAGTHSSCCDACTDGGCSPSGAFLD